jgi:WD40 repeat protein
LRKGHILYTLYGHDGPTSAASFSPGGDYFVTGGKDAVILIWKSNLEIEGGRTGPVEELAGLSSAKISTEVYVTDKDKVGKLPTSSKSKS